MTVTADAFHELTKADATDANLDVRHANPEDHTLEPTWLWEPSCRVPKSTPDEDDPASAFVPNGVMTRDGLSQIAVHKYKGGAYTYLDNFFSPYWQHLTEYVPMTMAPNTLTTLGLAHCVFAYIVTWVHSPNFDTHYPDWVIILNAVCLTIYYTLDCMDGKQARRTNSSSPLGQLFDHGIDCLCLMQHISSCQAVFTSGGTLWFFSTQSILQFSFFCAQWEEYYTGVLPHSSGNFGVTEVNYGMALASFINAFVDRKAIYNERIVHILLTIWPAIMVPMIIMSITRVFKKVPTYKDGLVAVTKLFSPFCLAFSPFILPAQVIQSETRFIHLAVGLAMTLVTIKIIVFSMAKQAFSTLQWDALPCILAAVWVRYDQRLTSAGVRLVWQVLTLVYLYRLHSWTSMATYQICRRLGIHLFKIAPVTSTSTTATTNNKSKKNK